VRPQSPLQVLWVLRGTHDVHDILTDLCGKATPIEGGFAHWGMFESSKWLLDNHLSRWGQGWHALH
jgi:hypothetical protein